jgi:hypothetical protein
MAALFSPSRLLFDAITASGAFDDTLVERVEVAVAVSL